MAILDFPKEVALWQRRVIPVAPKLKGAYRLALRSPSVSNVKGGSFVTWDIVTSEPRRAVFSTPAHEGLQFVTPYLFCLPSGDTDSIQIELAGEGEGFKKAVIIDPDGAVAGSMEAFIDLGDKGRYQYKATAKIPTATLEPPLENFAAGCLRQQNQRSNSLLLHQLPKLLPTGPSVISAVDFNVPIWLPRPLQFSSTPAEI